MIHSLDSLACLVPMPAASSHRCLLHPHVFLQIFVHEQGEHGGRFFEIALLPMR